MTDIRAVQVGEEFVLEEPLGSKIQIYNPDGITLNNRRGTFHLKFEQLVDMHTPAKLRVVALDGTNVLVEYTYVGPNAERFSAPDYAPDGTIFPMGRVTWVEHHDRQQRREHIRQLLGQTPSA